MMLIEVEHLNSTILSLNAENELTVENLKNVISQNIHIPATDLTLASNGSLLEDGHQCSEYFNSDACKVLLFLRKGEQIRSNIEVDFGHGKVVYIPACLKWTVGQLKQKLREETKGDPFDSTMFLTFARYIMEEALTLEEYKIREGSRITIFSYLNKKSTNKMNGKISAIESGPETNYPIESVFNIAEHSEALEKPRVLETSQKQESFEEHVKCNNEGASVCTTPSPPLPLESSKIEPTSNQASPNSPPTDPPAPLQTAEQGFPWNSSAHIHEQRPQNTSPSVKNGFESSGSWPTTMEPKTIIIPGGFRQRLIKPVFNKQFTTGVGISERAKYDDKMEVIFTDGSRKMNVELPITATVSEGLATVKSRISDSDKDKLRLFKGYVQMEGHHPLSQYGIVHGSTVVFKQPGPVRKF